MASTHFESRLLTPDDFDQTRSLFAEINSDRTAAYFHPHAFDEEQARRVCDHQGQDCHVGLFDDSRKLVGYGLLRGWEEGFAIPSLGIYISPRARGTGAAATFMAALHSMSADKGALKVRLKVHGDNTIAHALYTRLGYQFSSMQGSQHVGLIDLPASAGSGPSIAHPEGQS